MTSDCPKGLLIALRHCDYRASRKKIQIQVDGTFVAENLRGRGILKKLPDRLELSVDQRPFTDQADTVAVVCVVCPVDGAQRLNGLTGPTVPTVNRDAPYVRGQTIRHHNILLISGDQRAQGCSHR